MLVSFKALNTSRQQPFSRRSATSIFLESPCSQPGGFVTADTGTGSVRSEHSSRTQALCP